MLRYLKTDNETKTVKLAVLKFSKEIPVNNNGLRGVFTIKNFRKYQFRVEVDIVFKGKINAHIGRELNWYDSSILLNMNHKRYKISKVKLNRFLRKSLNKEVAWQLNYFSERFKHYSDIKKIEWL